MQQTEWVKVSGWDDVPVGDWIAILEDGKKGYLKARKTSSGVIWIFNGHFYFDCDDIIAYAKFPDYEG